MKTIRAKQMKRRSRSIVIGVLALSIALVAPALLYVVMSQSSLPTPSPMPPTTPISSISQRALSEVIFKDDFSGILAHWTIEKGVGTIENGYVSGTRPKWYGVGEDWALWSSDPSKAWTELIPKLKQWKFNTVRLAFAFPDSPPNTDTGRTAHSKYDSTKMNDVLNILSSNGIKAVLDLHNYLDMSGYFGSDAWVNNWVNLARTYKGDKRIAAFEIFNEPHEGTWDRSKVNSIEDVNKALARCIDAIRAVDPERTIIYPPPLFVVGPGPYKPLPPEFKRPNVIMGMHDWTNAKTVEDALKSVQGHKWRTTDWINAGWDIWVSEFGFSPELPWEAQKAFAVGIINYDVENGIAFSAWMYKTGGTASPARWDEILTASKYAPKFSTSSLLTSPAEVSRGETVRISVDIANTGYIMGTFTLTLKINGVIEATKEVTLAEGESATVTFEVARDVAGTYNVEVDGLTGAFTVRPSIGPAEFHLSDLSVSPREVKVGEVVTITVKITNIGGLEDTYTVALKVDGRVEATQDVRLSAGASTHVTFKTTKGVTGTYHVEVNGQTGTFAVREVAAPSPPPSPIEPWFPYIGVAIVAIAILATAALLIKKRK